MNTEPNPWERAQVMTKLYPDATDQNPPGIPKSLGNSIQLTMFVDADHAGNQVTRRIRSNRQHLDQSLLH